MNAELTNASARLEEFLKAPTNRTSAEMVQARLDLNLLQLTLETLERESLTKEKLKSLLEDFAKTQDDKWGLNEATSRDVAGTFAKDFLTFVFPPPTTLELVGQYPTGHPLYTRATWAHLAGKTETLLGYYDWLREKLGES